MYFVVQIFVTFAFFLTTVASAKVVAAKISSPKHPIPNNADPPVESYGVQVEYCWVR